ncbi:MAG: hypothetical protein V3S51_05785, partial [Dehalococcoidia bacterium]
MGTQWYNAYSLKIMDETGSSSEADLEATTNIVVEVRDTSDALSTLYTTRQGTTTLQNPFVMSQADADDKRVKFYSDDATVNVAVFHYGNGAQTTDHGMHFGRYGRVLQVTPQSRDKHIVMSRQDALRIVRVPLLATGTDADDTPASWDNALADCVIANGSSVEIIFPAGFHINDIIVEGETSDGSATFDLGFDNATESGDVDGLLAAAVCDTLPYQVLSTGTRGVLLQVSD